MTRAREKVKRQFEMEGVTIAEWARSHGFKLLTVYRVLDGSLKCTRGEGHRVAVALGLKKEPAAPRFRPTIAA